MENHPNYPIAFYFELSFNGEDAAFQEVSGISKELSIEEVACGGENRFKYRLPTLSTSQNLILKRALIPDGSELIDWCASCIDEGLANPIVTHDVSVSLLSADGTVCAMWTFHGAYPIKYTISDLKSQENSLVIESIELAYTYFAVSQDTMFGNLFN
ncbi:phage tail protein [Flavobacterium arcticum]|uniref:Phage tail protein n=1 Tax=Flavobacterium arcticum TaxID=1784713 RepID=A0A345HCS2_9FLAO|nr:phage tail protein [Flavobacterium arcticum]AXG74382.1 phage tail protein [Flavobacterium arcticum]KAF2507502.1 phage tail protein [Flavobacterium arcticum]